MKNAIRSLVLATPLLGAPLALAHDGGVDADDLHEQVAEARRATVKFFDADAAQQAGYAPFKDASGRLCIEQPGAGAMGVHYLNGEFVGDAQLDALRPEALMYAPGKDGALRLAGVEYIVFQDAWDAAHPQPPTLFGHPFHLVRSPNRYGVPAFYELHVWLWKPNPGGLFNDWNPRVACL